MLLEFTPLEFETKLGKRKTRINQINKPRSSTRRSNFGNSKILRKIRKNKRKSKQWKTKYKRKKIGRDR